MQYIPERHSLRSRSPVINCTTYITALHAEIDSIRTADFHMPQHVVEHCLNSIDCQPVFHSQKNHEAYDTEQCGLTQPSRLGGKECLDVITFGHVTVSVFCTQNCVERYIALQYERSVLVYTLPTFVHVIFPALVDAVRQFRDAHDVDPSASVESSTISYYSLAANCHAEFAWSSQGLYLRLRQTVFQEHMGFSVTFAPASFAEFLDHMFTTYYDLDHQQQ